MRLIGRLSAARADREAAESLEHALTRLERLRARGVDESEARREAAAHLNPQVRAMFLLAASVRDAAADPVPAPAFAAALEARLRGDGGGRAAVRSARAGRGPLRPPAPRWIPAMAAAAACLVAVVAVGKASTTSLPGDGLYPVKRAGESVRLAAASGRSEALLRVELADNRIDEVDGLVDRYRSRAVGVPGSDVAAAPVKDPRIARLIERTLAEAASQMRQAAEVLLEVHDVTALNRLAAVAHRGRATAAQVAVSLPETTPSADAAAGELQSIEAKAVAALQKIPPASPTPGPCATPTPTPTPSVTPAPSGTPTPSPTPTPTPTPSVKPTPTPTPTPSPTPSPTPCVSPTPTAPPSPATSPKTTATPAAQATPKPTPAESAEPAEPEPTPRPTPAQDSGTRTSVPSSSTTSSCFAVYAIRFC